MLRRPKTEFIEQQGFSNVEESSRALKYSALMFQPRLIGACVATGLLLQSAQLFLALSAVLVWNVAVPSLNLFDALHNLLIAGPRRMPLLGSAPAPRRFAQAIAGTLALVIGVSLLLGWQTVAWAVEALLAAALVTLIFGRFCLGSYLFHVLFVRDARAVSTCL